mmetsp:Transcript_524/g.654  ORF Transcript_524/g.654 Transcript_524/m.654 type:complete len:285 (+) Transcript_524:3952-4806(+)
MLKDPIAATRPGLKLLPDLVTNPGPVYNIRTVPGKGTPSHGFSKAERFSSSYSAEFAYLLANTETLRDRPHPSSTKQDFVMRKQSLPPYETRRSTSSLLRDDSPGPGSYYTSPPPNGRKTSFGSGDRSSIVNKNSDPVGPGAFNLRTEILSKRGAVLTTKTPFKFPTNESPGPASYSPKMLDLSNRISFPKSNREMFKQARSPRSTTPSPISRTFNPTPQNTLQDPPKPLDEIKELKPQRPMKRVTPMESVYRTKTSLKERERKLAALVMDFEKRKGRQETATN